MPRNFVEVLTGAFEDKQRWRAYRRRLKALPEEHRTTAEAVERYLMRSADSPTSGDAAATMYEGLVDLFEQAAADGTPVRDVVGDDPVEFADTFARTYSDGGWNAGERRRLRRAVDGTADGEEP
ncbi:DUF1048 domain-containing protein [Kineococcus sp. SYSU DK001]|uniref:DUF1048 domain-containing protein n=1 Tax=Kineococcus sp. SYSU DK001 TaxID=3383122 RepID=UPI003D7E9ADC